jgi:nitrite reductase/ring-hydroxylating ferredoxin subunit
MGCDGRDSGRSILQAARGQAGRTQDTEALYGKVEGEVEVADFLRVRLRGTTDRITLYEIEKLKPDACPHVKLPLFNRTSNIDDPAKLRPDESEERGGEVVCRWHKSRFDLVSGEVISWCEALHEDGTPPGMEMLGDISKNRSPLHVYRTRVENKQLWVSFDMQDKKER